MASSCGVAVVRAAEIREYEVDGIQVQGLATASRGAVEIMVWRNRMRPGHAFPATLRDHEQVVAVLSGEGVVREEGRELAFSAGDVLIVPAHALSQIVPGEESSPFDSLIAMPLATRHFTSTGHVMRLPWTE